MGGSRPGDGRPPVRGAAFLLAGFGAELEVQEALLARGEARLMVVGSDRRSVSARLLTGNVSTEVAASASAPVVAVPDTRQPVACTGVALVGVKRSEHSDGLLAKAFAVAHDRGSRLLVAHAWRMPSADTDQGALVRRAQESLPPSTSARQRAVLAHALCPVGILPAEHVLQVPDLDLEHAGAMSR